MSKISSIFFAMFILICQESQTQTLQSLNQNIQTIISKKKATVGISIHDVNGKNIVSINANEHYALQSVFKFHIALVVLGEIDKGKFSLETKLKIAKKDLLPGFYSTLRQDYPNGATLSIARLLTYMISESDNVSCEELLKFIGGTKVVQAYLVKNNFKDVNIKYNEFQQHAQWDLQYQNWTTPNATNEILRSFYENKKNLLSKNSYNFLWKAMKETSTGINRIKKNLPKNTIVAHKTGTSGISKTGLTAAVNDIGIVFLPNGKYYFISVLVKNSSENEAVNEKIIADVSKAAWDYFLVGGK